MQPSPACGAPADALSFSPPECQEPVLSDQERMLKYKALSLAFSYPDEQFFAGFPQLVSDREELISQYDRLFRAGAVWLYGAEHLADNEFQRVDCLADISGFYRAFGLEPGDDRPDALASELEFMYYLIFKWRHAVQNVGIEQADVCLDAQRKFFADHLYPGATRIAQSIMISAPNGFYAAVAAEMLEFLASEEQLLGMSSHHQSETPSGGPFPRGSDGMTEEHVGTTSFSATRTLHGGTCSC